MKMWKKEEERGGKDGKKKATTSWRNGGRKGKRENLSFGCKRLWHDHIIFLKLI